MGLTGDHKNIYSSLKLFCGRYLIGHKVINCIMVSRRIPFNTSDTYRFTDKYFYLNFIDN